MLRKTTRCFFIFACFLAFSFSANAQLPDYNKLTEYVNQERHASDAMKIIVQHLEQSGTGDPLEELVTWTINGFPELHDKNNYWNTSPSSIYDCVVSSINYLFLVSQLPDKAKYYLETVQRLKKTAILYQLDDTAYKILDKKELEEEFLRLIEMSDENERHRALILGRSVAEENRNIFDIYAKIAAQDKSAKVRNTSLHVLGTIRRNYSKEVARLALERLLVEKSTFIREIASVLVIQGADGQLGWAETDVEFLLSQMLKAEDNFVRKVIGIATAKLITDKKLLIIEQKVPENLFEQFVTQVKAKQDELKRDLEPDELLTVWNDWWIPLMPKYAVEPTFITGC